MTIFLCVVLGVAGGYLILSGLWIALYGIYLIIRTAIGK